MLKHFVFTVIGCVQNKKPQAIIPEIGVLRVNIESAVITSELPGRTAAFMIAEIRPQVNGLIQKRLFTEGTDVKAGAPN